jgi:hypothetical protein
MQPARQSGNERGECGQGLKTAKWCGPDPAPPGGQHTRFAVSTAMSPSWVLLEGRALSADMSIFAGIGCHLVIGALSRCALVRELVRSAAASAFRASCGAQRTILASIYEGFCVSARQQRTPLANSVRCFALERALREGLAAATRSVGLGLSMTINPTRASSRATARLTPEDVRPNASPARAKFPLSSTAAIHQCRQAACHRKS